MVLDVPYLVHGARTLARAGLLAPERPDRVLRALRALRRYGPVGALSEIPALRFPHRVAIVDERGELSFGAVRERAASLAGAWAREGIGRGSVVAVLARNHRGLLDAVFATARLGADLLLLNTDFAAPQLADVCTREGARLLVLDEEFAALAPAGVERQLAWCDDPDASDLEQRIARGATPPPFPREHGRIILLTSGTTGTPKGAPRGEAGLDVAVAYFEKIALRTGQRVYIAAPLFHALGFANLGLCFSLGSTVVLRRRFDPQAAFDALAGCHGLIAVPVMLQRMLATGDARRLPDLEVIVCGGANLDADLATRVMDRFGDVLHNIYGSTEVAWATIATPADLRAAPGCAGRPPRRTIVRLYDDDGRPVRDGEVGRIFVGNSAPFEGYTGGGTKQVIDGLMSTGDVGRFDDAGRLWVLGRDDDMIVSGGENVFPREVEDLLSAQSTILEAAVLGVPDADFGQRLAAYVVPAPGAGLDAEAVKTLVRENLARYKVPRDVVFVDELPRNPTGKVLKRDLPEV